MIWRGEVYAVELGQPIEHEPAFRRPAVVVPVTYADRAVARHFESDDSEDLTNQLNEYFHDLANRDAAAQVTVLAGPQIWCTHHGRLHALLDRQECSGA